MDIFKDNQADDYHVFVSDSEWMKELGLATFTTGTLYDWWYAKDEQNEFMNRPFVGYPADSNVAVSPEIFFKKGKGEDVEDGSAQVWRFTGLSKGKYEEQSFGDTWGYTDGRDARLGGDNRSYGANYTFDDLNIDNFDGVKFLAPTGDQDVGSYIGLLSDTDRFGHLLDFDGIKNVTNIIALNDHVRAWEIKYPDRNHDKWSKQALASYEFIEDIKTSKSGCLIYNVSMEFDVAPGQTFDTGGGNTGPALKTEDFIIKLYLYDDKSIRHTGKTAILTSTKHSAIPRDDLGRVGKRGDGEIEEGGTDPSEEVVGDIDLVYSSKTGMWKSGNKQILAKIVDEVSSATWVGDVDAYKEAEIDEIIEDTENPLHLVMGTGTAMPISMQNGNPLQWTPNYANPKSCRKDDKTKVIINVKNPSDKIFPKGKTVLLNEVNDEWMPMDFGSGLKSDEVVVTSSFEGRWDFTYFATSLVFFFRDDKQKKVSPTRAEKAFHVGYYKGYALNQDYYSNIAAFTVEHGYHQFSSFDFMDNEMGGTRGPKRSLGATVWGRDPVDTRLDDPNGLTSGPFFGCVFPNGYNESDVDAKQNGANNYSDSRSWDVKGLEGGDGHTVKAGKFFHSAGIPRGTMAMKEEDTAPTSKHAYIEGPTDTDGDQIPMFAAVAEGDNQVPHLPADIATHCSPSGLNGRPITNMAHLKEAIHGTGLTGSALQNHMRDTFFPPTGGAYKWMYKTSSPTDPADDLFNVYDSAFDFNPRTANKIQFRPLKMEMYTSLVEGPINSKKSGKPLDNDGNTDDPCQREEIWYKIATKMDDSLAPASKISRIREQAVTPSDIRLKSLYRDDYEETGLHQQEVRHVAYGLGWNIDYTGDDFAKYNTSSRFSELDHFRAGRNAFMMAPTEPAGAVGVIGAIATVSASKHIEFYTDQVIGMQSDFGGTLCGGVWVFSISCRTTWNPTWGGPNLRYDDFQTTDLSVRIYQAWPREQTIYDPRFFAVHHFNNGVTLSNVVKKTPEDTNGNSIADHDIDVAESTVDTREPSYVEVADQNNGDFITTTGVTGTYLPTPTTCPIGTQIFRDGVNIIGNPFGYLDNHPLLPTGQWNIESQRRGKLLPFKYEYKAALIPWSKDESIRLSSLLATLQSDGVYFSGGLPQNHDGGNSYIDHPATTPVPPATGGVETQSVQNVKMVVQDLGHDYKLGDRFKVLGSDAIFEVESVRDWVGTSVELLNPQYTNSIETLKVIDQGTYFDTGKLLPSGDADVNPVKSSTQGSAKLEPLSTDGVNGKGFKAYIAHAVVGHVTATDAKPKIATSEDYHQLSMPADNSPGGSTAPGGNSTFIPVSQGSRTVKADIKYDSADGLYDMFFHCHNDVTHTWMTNDFGLFAQHRDQYIDLTITPV